MQPPQRILAEIENILIYFRNKGFFFYDDNLTADRKRISEHCDILIGKGYDSKWTAQVRADLAKDTELVRKMAKAGLKKLVDDNIPDATRMVSALLSRVLQACWKQFH